MNFYIDFEATQFSERIISIGCVASNGSTFSSLVKPATKKDKVNKFITDLTGITNEDLVNAPTPDEAFNSLFDFVLAQAPHEVNHYYCYGNSDSHFIERTVSHMRDTRAIVFAKMLQHELKDYAADVKLFFQMNDTIALRKVYSLIIHDNVEQSHNALEDARMLSEVATKLVTNCVVEDKAKFSSMPKTVKPLPSNKVKRAPEEFINWPTNKWEADTHADASNWVIAAIAGPHVKYFDSLETAMLWSIKYITQGMSVKNLDHREIVRERIRAGLYNKKQSYGLIWRLKNGLDKV